ncbi:MAG: arginase [Nitrososphaerota archaeon]|nr:arginase [Nitrososphaerota archaeon]
MKIGVVGAPVDLGQQRRGVDMGPSAMRIARLQERLESLGHSVKDFGNISAADMATAKVGDRNARYLNDVVRQCGLIARRVADCVSQGLFPLVLGGDQSVSIGTLAGLSAGGTSRGVVWLDAHGDFNTPKTTPSGNIHGMALAAILGYGAPELVRLGKRSPMASERNTVLVGVRDLDADEEKAVSRSRVTVFTMKEIDQLGMQTVMQRAIGVAGDGVDQVHVSFDVDVVDPREAPGTGTPVRGGLTYREAHLAMETLSDSRRVTSAEFVEVNPILDTANHTAELAVEMMLSLLGKRIISKSA